MDTNLVDRHKQQWQQNRSILWCKPVYVEMNHPLHAGRQSNKRLQLTANPPRQEVVEHSGLCRGWLFIFPPLQRYSHC